MPILCDSNSRIRNVLVIHGDYTLVHYLPCDVSILKLWFDHKEGSAGQILAIDGYSGIQCGIKLAIGEWQLWVSPD
jgi:hypothetical protein